MINKKSPSAINGNQGCTETRHQELLEMYRHSGQTPREFVADCLQNRMLSGADAIELMEVLVAKTTTRSFALADLTDDDHFRLGFYETTLEDTENSPIFIMQLNHELVKHSEEIQVFLEPFARELAELISEHQDVELPEEVNPSTSRAEAMDTILASLPNDTSSH